MNTLQLTQKVMELMDRNRPHLIVHERSNGFDIQYGKMYLHILGGNSKESPYFIDVKFNEEHVGRLEYREPNKYYPSQSDAETLLVGTLYLSLWEVLKADRNYKIRAQAQAKVDAFLAA